MHEFALAEGLVKAVQEELQKLDPPPRGRLTNVRVVIGQMRQVVPDTLAFAYETMAKGTAAENSKIIIEPKPIAGACRACDWQGRIINHIFCCPECGSGNLKIKSGRELYLAGMEFDEQ